MIIIQQLGNNHLIAPPQLKTLSFLLLAKHRCADDIPTTASVKSIN